jgi:membrane protease YdiL (CAAX protease family)
MKINPNLTGFHDSPPLRRLIISMGLVIIGGTILFLLFLFTRNLLFNGDPAMQANPSSETGTEEARFIRFTLIAQDISFFIVPSLIILVILDPFYKTGVLNIKRVGLKDVLLVIILSFCAFPVTGIAGQLNSSMTMPHCLSGIEQWMMDQEDRANHLLDVIMTPETFSSMLLNLILIAALPAIAEELIFRGVFQKILQDLFRSGHLSVWITSVLFSAVHIQFYGFLPRLLLGLIFGYLFLWGRNIWLPVLAHFINNAVPTVGAYAEGWRELNQNSGSTLITQIAGMLPPLVIGIIILAWFRKRAAEQMEVYSDPSRPDQV